MQPTDKWNYYLDDDDCTCVDFFDSKEAALKAAMEDAKADASTPSRSAGYKNLFRTSAYIQAFSWKLCKTRLTT